jgi:hypothetical protein|tara:strand:- start:1362 stop:2339 length:978 start_codon:yes stop_codon:yes gene_type:complete
MKDHDYSDLILDVFHEKTVFEASFGFVYIKHHTQSTINKIFKNEQKYRIEAEKRGLQSEKQSMMSLKLDGLWTDEEENSLQNKQTFVDNLKKSLSKIQLPSQRDEHRKLINREQKNLFELESKKRELIGITSESYSKKRVNAEFLNSITFMDEDCHKPFLDDMIYDDTENQNEIRGIHESFMTKFSDDAISRAVLSPFFSPYFGFSKSPDIIFGKAMIHMTAYQLKIINYAKNFLSIFENCPKTIPSHVARDPELLIEFYDSVTNEKSKSKARTGEMGGRTMVGATKSDIEQLAHDDEDGINLSDAVKAKGGHMNMQDLMKLHGA